MLDCSTTCEYFDVGSTMDQPSLYEPPSGDRLYYFSTEQDSIITISTCSEETNYDTYLTLVEVTADGDFVVASNDDSECTVSGLQSTIVHETVGGRRYLIVVHGYSTREGTYGLSVSGNALDQEQCVCPPDSPCMHENDNSCSQRSNLCGNFVSEGGLCAAGTVDCHIADAPQRSTCNAISPGMRVSVCTMEDGLAMCWM